MKSSPSAELAIIIVSWNVKKLLSDCLTSIEQVHLEQDCEIHVVDNNSADGSTQMVAENFPRVILHALPHNLGFAAANNIALRQITAPYILLLNPDTRVLPGSLRILVDHLKGHPEVGVVGPMLLNDKGNTDPSCRRFPSFAAALHQYTIARHFFIFKPSFQRYMMIDFDHRSATLVDQVMGACMLVRKDVTDKVGLLDENFFMFYEEVDWCYRIKQAGYAVAFNPATQIVHLSDQSTSQIWDTMHFTKIKSLLHFFSKTKPRFLLTIYKPLFKIGLLLDSIMKFAEYNLKLALYSVIPWISAHRSKAAKYSVRAQQIRAFLHNYTGPVLRL